MNDDVKFISLLILGILLIFFSSISWVFKSHMEAKAYNHVTGQHVSTWDAMWVELRVQAGPANNTGTK
jgi:hypothetical protein